MTTELFRATVCARAAERGPSIGSWSAWQIWSREELATRVLSGAVTVLDVRPADEYAAGHIPGALSIPIDELELRLAELSADREIVAYCRGPYCLYAPTAVGILRHNELRARRLIDGFPEWRLAGLRVSTGTMA